MLMQALLKRNGRTAVQSTRGVMVFDVEQLPLAKKIIQHLHLNSLLLRAAPSEQVISLFLLLGC